MMSVPFVFGYVFDQGFQSVGQMILDIGTALMDETFDELPPGTQTHPAGIPVTVTGQLYTMTETSFIIKMITQTRNLYPSQQVETPAGLIMILRWT